MVGMLVLAAPSFAQTQISHEEFQARLDRAAELARLDGNTPSPERMADLRAAIGLPIDVVIGDWSGQIPRDPILEGLSGAVAADFERAGERLDALRHAVTEAASRERHPSARMAEALASAYRGVVPPRPDPFAIVLRAFGDVIQAIAQRVGSLVASAGSALAWIVLIGIVVFAAVFLFRSRLVSDRVTRADGARDRGTTSVDWAARAEEALRAGDLNEAVRASYLALLAVLAGRGIVANAPALTAGEARFAVRRLRPGLFPVIARATESYERVVYGGETPDRGDVDHLREAAAEAKKPR
jgi:Domain of unknown function (DUF4129)